MSLRMPQGVRPWSYGSLMFFVSMYKVVGDSKEIALPNNSLMYFEEVFKLPGLEHRISVV